MFRMRGKPQKRAKPLWLTAPNNSFYKNTGKQSEAKCSC